MSETDADYVDDLVAAGLYDPAAPDAGPMLELLEFLLDEVGASIPELVDAMHENRLMSFAAFRTIRPDGARVTLRDAAEAAGMPPELVLRVWRAAGFADPRPFERRFGDADVAFFDLVRVGTEFLGEEPLLQLVRTLGSASAQIAEAEIALVRTRMEAPLVASARYVDAARTYRDLVAALFPRVVDAIDTLHRHHVENIARRYSGSRTSTTNVVPLAVGFADLCGFTGLSRELSHEELGELLERFEAVTGDLVAAAGAHLVKRIGDALMFVTNAPGVACALALQLIETCAAVQLPKLRAGVAFGDVIVRHGDFYGSTVNLAARLVADADPGVALTDASLHNRLERVRGGYSFLPVGRLALAGFGDPIDAFQILRDGST